MPDRAHVNWGGEGSSETRHISGRAAWGWAADVQERATRANNRPPPTRYIASCTWMAGKWQGARVAYPECEYRLIAHLAKTQTAPRATVGIQAPPESRASMEDMPFRI